jgi:hypothetical protein
MTNIFDLENFDNFTEKINIDELYEKKQQSDMNKMVLFNKILNRIHTRIRLTSKQHPADMCCWYVIPEIIIGVPKYDQAGCIAYVLDKLKSNGFLVKYVHPNTIFITWKHFVPSYVRSELKKKTGIVVDEYGNRVTDKKGAIEYDVNEMEEPDNPNDLMFNIKSNRGDNQDTAGTNSKNSKRFTPIQSYKPSGSLVYNKEYLDKVEEKFL